MAADTMELTTDQLFIKLYKSAFPLVARYVNRRGGGFDEAKDVFQDALIVYYEKCISTGNIPRNGKAYLLGIAKNLWLKSYRDNSRYVPLDDSAQLSEIADTTEHQPLGTMLLAYLESSGQKCMDLLKSFYYDKMPMDDIAERFGFSGVRSATVQKFKCLEKVRDTVKSKALQYEDFVE